MKCQNPYCEAEATVKIHRLRYSFASDDEHYCSECIHEHVYKDRHHDL
jgi:hypothetical protein